MTHELENVTLDLAAMRPCPLCKGKNFEVNEVGVTKVFLKHACPAAADTFGVLAPSLKEAQELWNNANMKRD